MAKYDATHPALCLYGRIDSGGSVAVEQYSENDDTGLFGQDMVFEFTISTINVQAHLDASTRTPNQYTGIDVKAGDWVASANGEVCLRIKSISFKRDDLISVVAEDVDGINLRQYNVNAFASSERVIIFELSENGLPVIVGDAVNEFIDNSLDKLQSRFSIDEDDERFRFDHEIAPVINIGEIAAIDDYGGIVRHGTLNSSTTPVGTVMSKTRNGKSVYVKPFNKIIDNYPDPSVLTGSPGQTYYTDSSNPGGLSTTKTPGAKPVYMHLRDAIATEVISTSSTSLPDANDRLIINNITVFDGTIGHNVNNAIELKDMINAQTSASKVRATADIDDVSVESQVSNLHPAIGEVHILVSDNSGSSYTYPTAEFNDGTSTIQVTFDHTSHGITPTGFMGGSQYLILTAADMVQILNAEFQSNNINLLASSFAEPGKTYPYLKIEGQNNASISITNISADAFGTNFVGSSSGSGLEPNTPAGTNAFLKLIRDDGGDILITGGTVSSGIVSPTGGYINNNGICSSSSGTPVTVMMIEGSSEGGTAADVGVNVGEDHDMSPIATAGNGAPTGLYITYTPFLGSMVDVRVNGLDANLGGASDYQSKSCYFSPDGFIVRDINLIQAGDQLYWNGDFVGFNLDPDDDIDFLYQTSSSNI